MTPNKNVTVYGWAVVHKDRPQDLFWDMGNGACEIYIEKKYAEYGLNMQAGRIVPVTIIIGKMEP